jgi:hypothetical protein
MQSTDDDRRHTSDVLVSLINDTQGEGDISIKDIMHLLGERAFGLAILVFSLPNSLPIPSPPGFSTITGFPILIIAMQMALGRESPWLPKKVNGYSFSREKFSMFLTKSLPYIKKVERCMHPRLSFMHSKLAERIIGLIFLVLGAVLVLPIPLGNFLPGLAMSLIALGLIERDGLLMMGGMVVGLCGITLVVTVMGAVALAAITAFFSFL